MLSTASRYVCLLYDMKHAHFYCLHEKNIMKIIHFLPTKITNLFSKDEKLNKIFSYFQRVFTQNNLQKLVSLYISDICKIFRKSRNGNTSHFNVLCILVCIFSKFQKANKCQTIVKIIDKSIKIVCHLSIIYNIA